MLHYAEADNGNTLGSLVAATAGTTGASTLVTSRLPEARAIRHLFRYSRCYDGLKAVLRRTPSLWCITAVSCGGMNSIDEVRGLEVEEPQEVLDGGGYGGPTRRRGGGKIGEDEGEPD